MKVIGEINEINDCKSGIILTVGNFDGVHIGHQKFLNNIKEDSTRNDYIFLVITFVPHPRIVLTPLNNFLISPYDLRREYLESLGVDYLLEIDFTRDLSVLTPKDFLTRFISNSSEKIKKFYMGYDFSFGKNKIGNFEFVKNYYHYEQNTSSPGKVKKQDRHKNK